MTSPRDDLRARYRTERDKRLRPDGMSQYRSPTGRFATLLADPYTPRTERAPVADDVEAVVIGAGFAGLVAGAALRRAGVDDVRLIDSAGDVGGVWYWNRYPGAMCDTAAMIYLPLLEETGTVPTARYVGGREIHEHARRLARTAGLYDGALLHTAITDVVWDEAAERWVVRTDRGDVLRARFVVVGTGPLNRPKLPGIPGLESFAGEMFHTSRWEYDVTGGDPLGAPMTKLAGRRVGIIGTGATAVQCIPHLAASGAELFVFQRTPSSIDVRDNAPIDPDWFSALPSGWQRRWLRNFATLQAGGFADEDLVADGWTDISRRIRDRVVAELAAGAPLSTDTVRQAYEVCDDEKMDEIRTRVDSIVHDRATAEALKPWYRQLCKRPCFHDEYLATFNLPNVHLVDTDGSGVERVDLDGAWVGGEHHPLDVLVLASGFETGTALSRRTGFDIAGRDGLLLDDHWSEGMRTLHGIHVHGFPNLFVVGHAQGANLISNITHNYVEVSDAIADVVTQARRTGARRVEATSEAEGDWVELMDASFESSMLGDPSCTPGYYNNEGAPIGRRERLGAAGHPDGPVGFFEHLDRWRAAGTFTGLEFDRAVPVDADASVVGEPSRRRVVVVGAGLAGLVAARALVRADVDVVVLEARERIGGRAHTQAVLDGMAVEAGGMWIGPGQDAIASLVDEFGLGTIETPTGGDLVLGADGELLRLPGVRSADTERIADVIDALAATVPVDAPWDAPDATRLDTLTVLDWLLEQQASDEAVLEVVIETALAIGDASEFSMLWLLTIVRGAGGFRALSDIVGGAQERRVVGGIESLAGRLAAELGTRVRLGEPVRSVAHGPSGAVVETSSATYPCDEVVVAMMPSDADRIAFRPPLPAMRQALQHRWTGSSGVKVTVTYPRPFWRDDRLSGSGMMSEGAVGGVMDITPPDRAGGCLVVFVAGEHEHGDDALRSAVLRDLAMMFGPEAATPTSFHSYDWSSDAWSSGCVSALRPGVLTTAGRALVEPVGCIRWAGTETSGVWRNYLDGAVRSGRRVAAEIAGEGAELR